MNRQETPLRCVIRVHSLELLSETSKENRLPVRVDFDVQGLGRWQHDLSIYIPAELKPLGIKLTIIEPGPHRTDFLDASSLERSKNVIGDYGETACAARKWADNAHNSQPGDPAKAAAAMVKLTEVENPPLRLQLGADCVAAVEAKLDQVKVELNQWRDLAMSTAYTE